MSNNLRTLKRAKEREQPKMGIQATLGDLVQSQGSLGVLLSQQMPITASFKLGKIAKAIGAEMEAYLAAKKSLCERYANTDGEGVAIILNKAGNRVTEGEPGEYDIPKDKLPDVEKEHAELMATSVTIPGEQIKISELANVTIAPAHLMILSWLIAE